MKQRKKNRLNNFDYANPGHYFVTICTKGRVEWFGKVQNDKMVVNEYGTIVQDQWEWMISQYPYLRLDEYIVMPNHVHGIVTIVGNGRDRSLRRVKPLPQLIGAFKTTSSKLIHRAGAVDFQWQKSFYDRILCDERSLDLARKYIVDNPSQWARDPENTPDLDAETREIMNDPVTMHNIVQGEADFEKGRTVSWERVKVSLGIH